MAKLRDLVEKSTLLITNCISDAHTTEVVTSLLVANRDVYSKFRKMVVAINKTPLQTDTDVLKYIDEVKKYYPYCTIITEFVNRGWQFGTMDLEKMAYDYIKTNIDTNYIVKADADIMLFLEMLDIEIDDDTDFYALPSIGYATTAVKHEFNVDAAVDLFDNLTIEPQSWFYIMKPKVDWLYISSDWIDDKHNTYIKQTITGMQNVTPPMIGVACEPLLHECIKNNRLKMKYLISKDTFRKLVSHINEKQMHDCSHKSLLFKEVGVCHLLHELANQEVIEI